MSVISVEITVAEIIHTHTQAHTHTCNMCDLNRNNCSRDCTHKHTHTYTCTHLHKHTCNICDLNRNICSRDWLLIID
uniref:Uncharacterized protein n=1 Tax=Arion vulgaris TaxID=1028688 RepID=A0A0B6XZE5_9EUPU